jgi:WD40 repeat protein
VVASPNPQPGLGGAQHAHAVIGLTTDSKGNVALLSFDHDHALRRWSLGQGENHTNSSAEVLHLTFSPDDRDLLHVSKELTSHVWDVKTKKIKATLSGYNEQINRAAFSPNGKFVVAGSYDHSVHLWSSRTGHRLATFRGDGDHWRTAEFTPDGLAIIAVSDQGKVWTIPCEELSDQFEALVQRRMVDTGVSIENKYVLGR